MLSHVLYLVSHFDSYALMMKNHVVGIRTGLTPRLIELFVVDFVVVSCGCIIVRNNVQYVQPTTATITNHRPYTIKRIKEAYKSFAIPLLVEKILILFQRIASINHWFDIATIA